jgi:hypothetical protein
MKNTKYYTVLVEAIPKYNRKIVYIEVNSYIKCKYIYVETYSSVNDEMNSKKYHLVGQKPTRACVVLLF